MRKLLTSLILGALSSVAAVCQAEPMSDDWYVADMVRVNGGSRQPMSPVDYLSARCPGATLGSLQPFFVPSQGIEPIRMVLGYTHPASGKCPSQAGQL